MANVPRTPRTPEEIKAANEAYLKTKGVTNTPSGQMTEAEIQADAAQQAQATGASPSTAYTGGYNPVTGQVLSGVGSNRFNEAVAVNRAINRQRAQYTNDPALAAYQKPITAYDSRSAEGQRLRNPLVVEAAMQEHAMQANRGLPNATLTMIPGHGYIVDPRRQAPGSPYGLSPMRANQVPAQVTSPAPVAINQAPVAPVAINQAPVAPVVATLPPVPNRFNRDRWQGGPIRLGNGYQPATVKDFFGRPLPESMRLNVPEKVLPPVTPWPQRTPGVNYGIKKSRGYDFSVKPKRKKAVLK
jgi:hypothetical protein